MAHQKYRWHLGSFAWVLHRLTGALLALYLVWHIWVVRTVSHGPEGFDRMMRAVQTPLFVLSEMALLAAVLYHSLNGIRHLLMDVGWGVRHQKGLFLVLMAAWALLLVMGGLPIIDLLERSLHAGQ